MDGAVTGRTIPRFLPGRRLQWEAAQNCWVILYAEGMVKLNPSAAEILKRIDGTRTVADIIADLRQTFSEAKLDNEVYQFLETAHVQQWIYSQPGQ